MQDKKIILFVVENGREHVANILAKELNEDVLYQAIVIEDIELKNFFKKFVNRIVENPKSSFENKISLFLRKRRKRIIFKRNPYKYLRYKSVINMVYRYAPAAIITNTHECLAALEKARKELGMNFQLFVMPDELTLNPSFKSLDVDYYFVDNFDMRTQLLNDEKINDTLISIDSKKITIAPLPVEDKYLMSINKEGSLETLKLTGDVENIIVFANYIGDNSFEEVIDYAAKISLPYKLSIYCGNNKKSLDYATSKNLTVFGENTKLYDLLCVADKVIGRPTMVLMKACLALKIHFIAMNPLGKRETENMHYLVKEGLISYASNLEELNVLVHSRNNFLDGKDTSKFIDKNSTSRITKQIKELTKNVVKSTTIKKKEQL